MRAPYALLVVGTITQMGCQQTFKSDPTQKVPALVGTQSTQSDAAALTSGLVGTWKFSMEQSDPVPDEWATVELFQDGHFKWLPTGEGYMIPPEKGSWFVHQKILVLRLGGNCGGHMPSGSALTFDIKTLTPESATMTTPVDSGPGEVKQIMWNWKRVPQLSNKGR